MIVPNSASLADDTVDAEAADTSDVAVLHHHLVRVTRALRTSGTDNNLSVGTASALWTINAHGPLRMSALAEREAVALPTVSRLVAGLEQLGYVTRTPDPDDRRARLLVATPEGADVITHARSKKAQLLRAAMDRMDSQQQRRVHAAIEDLADALAEEIST
ncbi:MarR family winged helix-turn-helix transcriptional regulator [Gordonia otitidis]|uniref:MarR family transcriptional regulator n=1 Tax=Gordonia otitidis (strain DSM 44809 / CCUG 52243 / JCM 12355 / NBRC 100426 / IFM 10032) TaxID=1108044 RepID=H5TQK7_GORO1|nr:MarR family transcriptional regulator [Gordonia otitidis]GAB35765.1 putative MarR family transcriptional regulator [Gordonia otitidis NBRC 100426]